MNRGAGETPTKEWAGWTQLKHNPTERRKRGCYEDDRQETVSLCVMQPPEIFGTEKLCGRIQIGSDTCQSHQPDTFRSVPPDSAQLSPHQRADRVFRRSHEFRLAHYVVASQLHV